MLETFYNSFGFAGSILLAFVGFILFILWVAGIAGITHSAKESKKNTMLIISILFPPYPFFWMLYDMYCQKKLVEEK